MKRDNRLALYTDILPALTTHREQCANEEIENLEVTEQIYSLKRATVFDCRKLPSEFVLDTGDAAFDETQQTKGLVRLPYPTCYFEFDDESAVFAEEVEMHLGDQRTTCVHVYEFAGWGIWDSPYEYNFNFDPQVFGEFGNGFEEERGEARFFAIFNEHVNVAAAFGVKRGAKALLGVLALMNDRLIAQEVVSDPMPKLNQKRAKNGKPPISGDVRVLTINTGAVRKASRSTALKSHESPCLHWRRGHWRVLHRGSEFESKTWVRRCLVGDPSLGFVRKDYRLTHELPMITHESNLSLH